MTLGAHAVGVAVKHLRSPRPEVFDAELVTACAFGYGSNEETPDS